MLCTLNVQRTLKIYPQSTVQKIKKQTKKLKARSGLKAKSGLNTALDILNLNMKKSI